jgi:opacity protein-like surface antigen
MTYRQRHVYGAIAGLIGIACAPLTAHARDGWFAGGEFGGNFQDNETFSNGNGSFDAGYADDVVWGINAGYSYPSGFRPELSIEFRSNNVDNLSAQGNSTSNVSGHEDADTFMGNLWYDIKLPQRDLRKFHPHIGAGIGFAQVGVHGVSTSNLANFFAVDDDQTLFAYQFGLGVGYDLAPNWVLSADFHYLATDSGDFHYSAPAPQLSGTVNGGYSAESLIVGLRYEFGPRLFQ